MESTSSPSSGSASPDRAVGFRWRLQASVIHLGISALIALIAAGLVFLLWYPAPFRDISGGRELFFIVVAVDVVLGPLVTFAVFDRRKPTSTLMRDLTLVAALQLSGLAYGLLTVFEARPVVVALERDRLRVVRAIDLRERDLVKAPPELRRLPLTGVRVVATRKARVDEQGEAISRALEGQDIGMRPEFWLPQRLAAGELARAAKPLSELRRRHPGRETILRESVAATGLSAEQLGYLPLLARSTNWVALIDRTSGEMVGYAPMEGL